MQKNLSSKQFIFLQHKQFPIPTVNPINFAHSKQHMTSHITHTTWLSYTRVKLTRLLLFTKKKFVMPCHCHSPVTSLGGFQITVPIRFQQVDRNQCNFLSFVRTISYTPQLSSLRMHVMSMHTLRVERQ